MGRPREHDERNARLRLLGGGGADRGRRRAHSTLGPRRRATTQVLRRARCTACSARRTASSSGRTRARRVRVPRSPEIEKLQETDDPASDLDRHRRPRLPPPRTRAPGSVPDRLRADRAGTRGGPELDSSAADRMGPARRKVERLRPAGAARRQAAGQAASSSTRCCEGLANAELRGARTAAATRGRRGTGLAHVPWRRVVRGFATSALRTRRAGACRPFVVLDQGRDPESRRSA